MKKSVYTLLMSCLLCLSVYAIYDEPVKVLRIFNGGVGTTIQLSHVDSLMHSRYDADSIQQSDYLQSVIYSLDSIYNIPTASIDSIVVEDLDVEEYQNNINSIEEYIGQQEELAVEPFQNNLLEWLNAQEWVDHAVINDERDFITVTLNSGLESFVCFQNISYLYHDEDSETNSKEVFSIQNSDDNSEIQYYDVSRKNDEIIVNNNKILFVQGCSMVKEGGIQTSTSQREYSSLSQAIAESPIRFEMTRRNMSLSFMDDCKEEYGMKIVSQTHGVKKHRGAFLVEDTNAWNTISDKSTNYKGFLLYVEHAGQDNKYNKNTMIVKKWEKNIFMIMPKLGKQIISNSPIVYAGYCYSDGIRNNRTNSFFGYKSEGEYETNTEYIENFFINMSNGMTFMDATDPLENFSFSDHGNKNDVKISKSNKKHRYFSIKTVSFSSNSQYAGFAGYVFGVNNLKTSEMSFKIWYSSEKFTKPSDNLAYYEFHIDESRNGKTGPYWNDQWSRSSDGTQLLLYKFHFVDTKEPTILYYCLGFEFNGKVYYGDINTSYISF